MGNENDFKVYKNKDDQVNVKQNTKNDQVTTRIKHPLAEWRESHDVLSNVSKFLTILF